MNIGTWLALRGRTLKGRTVVHVGAHAGEEAGGYEALGAGTVVWVEADPAMAARLRAALAARAAGPQPWPARLMRAPRTRHIAIEALAGDAEGQTVAFREFNNDGASKSVFPLHDAARGMFGDLAETGAVRRLTMRRLDSLLAEAGVRPDTVDVLVLDVQGAELLCLKGAEATLRAAEFVEVEVSTVPIYDGGVLWDELRPWLEQRGFRPVSRVSGTHTDAIFRRAR